MSRSPGRLAVGLAAAATVILLVSIGAAAFMLPLRADDGRAAAQAGNGPHAAEPAPTPAAGLQPAPAAHADAGAVIAGTFNQLQATPVAGPATTAVPAPTISAPAVAAPTTHFVQTIHIAAPAAATAPVVAGQPDPAPVEVADAAPNDPPGPADSAVSDATPAAGPAAPDPAEAAADTAPASVPEAQAAVSALTVSAPVPLTPPKRGVGNASVIGGSGATVRSGPSTGRGQLFNLAPGQKVTITNRQRGWAQIVDGQGRHGWVYASLLSSR